MISLDTNFLIGCLVPDSPESRAVIRWRRSGESLCTSSICWYEFLCGPVNAEQVAVVKALLDGGILPFGPDEAREASRLFNESGRMRRLRVDAMIAASAILQDARLATANQDDFRPFRAAGLDVMGERELAD